jgi:hypothetical protein
LVTQDREGEWGSPMQSLKLPTSLMQALQKGVTKKLDKRKLNKLENLSDQKYKKLEQLRRKKKMKVDKSKKKVR